MRGVQQVESPADWLSVGGPDIEGVQLIAKVGVACGDRDAMDRRRGNQQTAATARGSDDVRGCLGIGGRASEHTCDGKPWRQSRLVFRTLRSALPSDHVASLRARAATFLLC